MADSKQHNLGKVDTLKYCQFWSTSVCSYAGLQVLSCMGQCALV